MNKNKKGFTLIELLVVIAIIGLLSTLSVLALNSARARARDAKRISDVKQIQTALEMYYNEAGQYPASVASGGQIATGSPLNIYMKVVPTAPIPVDGNCDGTMNTYTYAYVGTSGAASGSYTLTYCLGAATGGVAAGVGTATPAGIK
ncbi:MAG: prepilin-type N-terminal cleavage/methylation domain-containing protein [bacterium]|nr:prepilin-type N-terminal cleavage/methylation domain-containing protein [bacterium]